MSFEGLETCLGFAGASLDRATEHRTVPFGGLGSTSHRRFGSGCVCEGSSVEATGTWLYVSVVSLVSESSTAAYLSLGWFEGK